MGEGKFRGKDLCDPGDEGRREGDRSRAVDEIGFGDTEAEVRI